MNKLIWMGLVTVLGLSAVETRAWRQTDYSDFEKGSLKRLSLGSDGRLTLAPVVKELLDPSVGYMWACAEDSKGNLYAGGGSTTGTSAKLFMIDKAGKSSVAAELEGMEIHAIAIDAKDTVYAATSPDGKIYRIHKGGKPEVFFDPKSRYIWAMVFGANGDLYVGTGDKGQIFRVSPEGQGSVFFETDESHARSLAVDGQGDLIVGTEPSGLVLRVSAAGKGFVLQQMAKREVTAVAVSKSGVIYAAAVGNRGPAVVASPAVTPAAPPPAAAPQGTGTIVIKPATTNHSPSAVAAVPTMAGGSEVVRIDADGYARKIWSHTSELVYSIAFDSAERPVVATGNHGNVYRLDSQQRYTLLTSLEPTQVTQLLSERSGAGAIFAVTGNIAKVYKIGPELEHEGVFESDLLDAGAFTYWGRLEHEGRDNGGRLRIETRSGNLNDAHKNWSPWAALGAGARVESPAARFVQYKLELTAGSNGTSPDVDAVDLKFQAKNIAPVVEQVEITPPNYKFPAPAAAAAGGAPAVLSPATLNLPLIGRKRTQSGGVGGSGATASETTPSLSYAKGFTGVRWAAIDENGDTLTFRVEIRGVKESAWTVLRDKVREHYLSWDSTAYADGEYVVRITASDSPSNIPEEAKSASLESEPFLVDNAAPEIVGLTASSAGAGKVNVAFRAKDGLSNIVRAEYSVNGGDWTEAEPVTRLSDAKELNYKLTIDRGAAASGEFTVAVRVADEFDNQTVAKVEGR